MSSEPTDPPEPEVAGKFASISRVREAA